MAQTFVNKSLFAFAAAAMAFGGFAGTAHAQRDPAYAAARSAGQVGEKMDGYLGVVGTGTPAIQRIVKDINIKRRAVYTQRAAAKKSTIEEYAFTSGCLAIAATVPGEKYQAPDGSWQTRTNAPPMRDSRCAAA
ncbi:YdbL family protein [Pontixanthobacter sp. CEM42]|uniref:YdbL family protein n=1 Tax=Pontixanthobacter sp. CEM42 TaxID=2792077 RepID=UPI001ADF6578|nr:YdbL family protein [Pontixanthobacter sp. CEM42]